MKDPPEFPYLSTPEETIVNFLDNRKRIHDELRGGNKNSICSGCQLLTEFDESVLVEKIENINISFYPSVCQCKCVYCGYADHKTLNNYEEAKKSKHAEYLSVILPYLEKNGFLNKDRLYIQCSPGEITIHPHKELILESIQKYRCGFLTNAFVYDEKIAEVLSQTKSFVMHSIDAGTRETYYKIKGFDLFEKVLDTLQKYKQRGGVVLKYIVLPEINDNDRDFDGVIEVLKTLKLRKLIIGKDNREQTSANYQKLCRSVPLLMRKLQENSINYELQPLFGNYEQLIHQQYNEMERA